VERSKDTGYGDTSQRGNGTCFRNETLNGYPMVLTSEWIMRSLPPSGILRFDFVCTVRPQMNIPALTSRRFCQLLRKLGFKAVQDDYMAATLAAKTAVPLGSTRAATLKASANVE
jgi:hypothetical protein